LPELLHHPVRSVFRETSTEETIMADNSGGIGILGVVIGALIVLGVGFFLLNGNLTGGSPKSVNLNINPPATTSPK
jgi:hypothetical protein